MPAVGHQVERETRQGPLPPRPRRLARSLYGSRQALGHHERRRAAARHRAGAGQGLSAGARPVGVVTVESIYAFTDTRPDEEKWELIDGELVLNQSPTLGHQWILGNLMYALTLLERKVVTSWVILPGFGIWISDKNRPQADLIILPRAEIF